MAHLAPLFGILLLLMGLGFVIEPLPFFRDHVNLDWWRRKPDYWMLAVQILLIGAMILFWWKHYEIKWSFTDLLIGAVFGVIGIGIWIIPTHLYDVMGFTEDPESGFFKWIGVKANDKGFNPSDVFTEGGGAWWTMVLIRFFRACVIVAIAEEICWRGFIMRFAMNPDGKYWKIPFGTHSWIGFAVSTVGFMLIHPPSYYIVAALFGIMMYVLCIWRKSLFGCIVMHGVANLVMGLYAFHFEKYGLW